MRNEHIVSMNTFLSKAPELLDDLKETHTPLILMKDEAPVAVVQGMDDYRKFLDALYMLKLMVQGEKEIQEGKGREQTEVFADIERLLESKDD